jgi:hypothetical protein
MPVTVRFDARKLRQLERSLPAAIARAINKSAVSARVVGLRNMREESGLKVGQIREQVTLTRATAAKPKAELRVRDVRGRRIPMIEFRARGPEPSRGRGPGVTFMFRGRRIRVRHAFIATMRSGHRGVFVRVRPSRKKSPGAWSLNLPIRELPGPSLVGAFVRSHPAIGRRFLEAMEANLKHEVEFVLQRLR